MSQLAYAGKDDLMVYGRPRYLPRNPRHKVLIAIITELANGQTISEAAKAGGMSYRATDNVLRLVRQELGLLNTTHLVAHYLRNGWID